VGGGAIDFAFAES